MKMKMNINKYNKDKKEIKMTLFNEKTKISEGVREITSEGYRDINSQPERFFDAKAPNSAFLSEGWSRM